MSKETYWFFVAIHVIMIIRWRIVNRNTVYEGCNFWVWHNSPEPLGKGVRMNWFDKAIGMIWLMSLWMAPWAFVSSVGLKQAGRPVGFDAAIAYVATSLYTGLRFVYCLGLQRGFEEGRRYQETLQPKT